MTVEPFRMAVEKAEVVVRYLAALARAPRLRAAAEGDARTALTAVVRTLRFDLSPEERAWTSRLKALRRETARSREPITRLVYGLKPGMPGPPGQHTSTGRVVADTVGAGCRRSSRQCFWCLLLFRLVREFRPERCLELGTAFGISAGYQGAALVLNGAGRLVTLEGDPAVASLAADSLRSLGVENVAVVAGDTRDTLSSVLARHGPVDFAFFDAGKTRDDVLDAFAQVAAALSPRAVLVFDDITWSAEMQDAWEMLRQDRRVRVSIDLGEVGICLVGPEAEPRRSIRLPMA